MKKTSMFWRSRKYYNEIHERNIPVAGVLRHLLAHHYNESTQAFIKARLEEYEALSEERQYLEFGRMFLLIEKFLLGVGVEGEGESSSRLREKAFITFPGLSHVRPFTVARLPHIEQEIELARDYLIGLLRSLPTRIPAEDSEKHSLLEEWLVKLPEVAWPPPFAILRKQAPASSFEWVDSLIHIGHTLRPRLARLLGNQRLLCIERAVYKEFSGYFEGLESFPVLYEILPVELLDGSQVGALKNRRELLDQFIRLDQAHREVQEANRALSAAKSEMEILRAESDRMANLLREVLNTAGEAILSIDDDGLIVIANRESGRLWGYSLEALKGMAFNSLLSPAYVEKINSGEGEFSEQSSQSLFGKWIEMEGLRADGRTFPMELQARRSLIPSESNTTLAIRDLTEHKRAIAREQELRDHLDRMQRMESLGMLAGGVAHDLNNILGPLVAYPPMLLDALPNDSPLREDIFEMAHSARRAAAIVQDLLTMSRRGHYEFESIDLNNLVRRFNSSVELKQRLREGIPIHVALDLEERLPPVKGSLPHLSKVLLNLAVNAIEAMPEGGTLSFTTRGRLSDLVDAHAEGFGKMMVRLEVADTGMGIPPEALDRIFEPFFSTKKLGRSGSGLGLSVVFGVVQDLNGHIQVCSQPGHGTTFIIDLPCGASSVVEEEDEPLALPGGVEKILVVDDELAQRRLASRILKNAGYDVVVCAGGREGVALLDREHDVDLVLLDMIMEPGFDGLDTYRAIREKFPQLSCILASGFAESERATQARELGARAFLKKPYERKDLLRVVRRVLDERV